MATQERLISDARANSIEDIGVLGASDERFDAESRDEGIETIRLIMKDGKVYKNTLK